MDNVSNPTLVPQTQIDYQPNPLVAPTKVNIGGTDPDSRLPDSTFMQAGVLKTIWYPTGGHTNFAYQTNRYLNSAHLLHLTGGLRVDTINSYDGISAVPIVKTSQYNKARANFMTAGPTGLINYGFFVHTMTYRYWFAGGELPRPCVTKRVRSYNSEPSSNLTPTKGNPVAYSNVTEYIGTPGVNTGKTVYMFRDTTDYFQTETFTGVPVI